MCLVRIIRKHTVFCLVRIIRKQTVLCLVRNIRNIKEGLCLVRIIRVSIILCTAVYLIVYRFILTFRSLNTTRTTDGTSYC